MLKKVLSFISVFILGLTILNGISELYRTTSVAAITTIDNEILLKYFFISLLSILLGILVEWKKLLNILKGKIKVNWLFIPSVILLVASLVPSTYMILFFGFTSYQTLPHGLLIAPFQNTHTILILNILAGILIIRSLAKG
jgi:hypothetical protein